MDALLRPLPQPLPCRSPSRRSARHALVPSASLAQGTLRLGLPRRPCAASRGESSQPGAGLQQACHLTRLGSLGGRGTGAEQLSTPLPRSQPHRRPREGWLLPCEAAAAEGVEAEGDASGSEDVGEVEKIVGSRVVEGVSQFLIQWKDDHPDSWEPQENISPGLLEDYVQPWWEAVKKGEDAKIRELLLAGRDPDAIDTKKRTALFFAAGFGHDKSVQVLLEAGADVLWQDEEGYTPLHMAAGYVQTSIVRLLLDKGADPEIEDAQKRSPLTLAKELLEKTPQTPFTLGRRIALDQVVKMLDEAIFEEVEVQQVLDRRIGDGGVIEYLVRWSDGSEDSWEPAENIGEDLIRDYTEGLEYGVAEKILEKRGGGGGVEYLVKWADSGENTWEPAENIAVEVVAEFEGASVEEVEKRLELSGKAVEVGVE